MLSIKSLNKYMLSKFLSPNIIFSADEKDTALTNAKWSKLLKTFCKAARHKVNSGTENLIPHEFPRQFVTKGYVTRLSRTLLFIDLTCQCVIEPLPNPINLEDPCWELRTLRQLPPQGSETELNLSLG